MLNLTRSTVIPFMRRAIKKFAEYPGRYGGDQWSTLMSITLLEMADAGVVTLSNRQDPWNTSVGGNPPSELGSFSRRRSTHAVRDPDQSATGETQSTETVASGRRRGAAALHPVASSALRSARSLRVDKRGPRVNDEPRFAECGAHHRAGRTMCRS
jgi:hypothetical protein